MRVSGELGYAPTTQTRASEGLAGSGDVDGWAWNFTASIMNFHASDSEAFDVREKETDYAFEDVVRDLKRRGKI